MMLPLSGQDGFAIWNTIGSGDLVQPIYEWGITVEQNRSTYRTASSNNFPVRRSGTFKETIFLRGVDYVPPFVYDGTPSSVRQTLTIGWYDLANELRYSIPSDLMWNNFTAEFNYKAGVIPAFQWFGEFSGIINRKEVVSESIHPFEDVIRCPGALCNKPIETTDTLLNSGEVHHVTKATIRSIITREDYIVADSNNRPTYSTGVFDTFLDLDLEGDFDYWLDVVNDYDQINDYKIWYGDGLSDFWLLQDMKIFGFSCRTNIQTGEMVSARVNLGAALG